LKHQDACVVNVTWENEPPVADAGADQEISDGSRVSLDGSRSLDNDDGIQLYQWSQIDGYAVTLSDAGSARPYFTAPYVGPEGASLRFQLVVSDYNGLQSTDTCIVNITWQNRPPVSRAGEDRTVKAGDAVVLDGTASSDPDDGIAAYSWTQTSGTPVTLSNPSAASTTFIAPESVESVTMTFTLKVTDAGGLSHEDSCSIAVSPNVPVDPPRVAIITPTESGSFSTQGDTIHLSGTATGGSAIERVLWSTSHGDHGVAQGGIEWRAEDVPLREGSNTITITAEDIHGQQGQAVLTVTRSLPDQQAPTLEVTAPTYSGKFIFATRSKISFSGTSSDDTGVEKVVWKNSRGYRGIADGTTTWSIQDIPLKRWWNKIVITAEDAAGNKSRKTILVFYWR
jgi:hypothetical protein